MTLDLPAIRARAEASRFPRLTSTELLALLAEVERLREALAPFAAFAAKWAAKPIGKARDEDTLYGIHSGTEWEALLTLGDFKRARTALEAPRG